LQVASGGKGLVGHAGAVLLRRCADRTGLTGALNKALPRGKGPGWGSGHGSDLFGDLDRARRDEHVGHQPARASKPLVFADPPSEATVRRALAGLDTAMLGRIAKPGRKSAPGSGTCWPAGCRGSRG
jgi:hypothetical protein